VFPVRYEYYLHIKSKAVSVTGRGGLYGCEMLRTLHCLDNRLTDGGEVVSLMHRPRSAPQKKFCILSLVLISVRG
jgi:hypothetical protein